MKKLFIFCLIAIFALPFLVSATIGVGVGTGEIRVKKPLLPGGIYDLPSLVVFNTGTEPADYEVEITYHSKQPQMRPRNKWFSFTPCPFRLEPGKPQEVSLKLTLPVDAKIGDYFGYVEAHPIVEVGRGTTIGVAAAAKLYFSIAPANIWQAIGHRISTFFAMYAPWPWVVIYIIIAAIALILFRKYFSFNIGISKKGN